MKIEDRLTKKGQRGFTLIELATVMAILAVLAAIVVPTVTGLTTSSRSTSQSLDMNTVQEAVDRHNSEDNDGAPWPTDASLTGVTTTWTAGNLPSGTGPTGTGTSVDPYVFTQNDIAGINFTSSATTRDGSTKAFYPDFLRSLPNRNDVTISVASSSTSSTFKINKKSLDVYVQLSNVYNNGAVIFDAWGLDKTGGVWVFVDKGSY